MQYVLHVKGLDLYNKDNKFSIIKGIVEFIIIHQTWKRIFTATVI